MFMGQRAPFYPAPDLVTGGIECTGSQPRVTADMSAGDVIHHTNEQHYEWRVTQ